MRSFKIIGMLSKFFLRRYLRDKVALFFSFVFPIVFLVVFGLLNRNVSPSFSVAIINNSETAVAKSFADNAEKGDVLERVEVANFDDAKDRLSRGELDAILELPPEFGRTDASGRPSGSLVTYVDEGDQQLAQSLNAVTEAIIDGLNAPFVQQDVPFKVEQRKLQTANLSAFDYTFAGLLGFALISLGIFGMASGFASDKKLGAYRRMRVAPIKAWHLIVATGLMYAFIGLLVTIMMYALAVAALDFTMRGNLGLFLAFATFSTICLYGFGIAIAGWARNENQAAPVANLVAFPMMFLSGTFFPRFLMPEWLQGVTFFLPLTPVVDGLRKITTENAGLLQLGPELAVIGGWIVVIYLLAFKLFRWE